jgi:DNA polymerase
MFTEPKLVGDTNLLGEIWREEAEAKRGLLAALGVTGKELRANEVFANLLRAQGVEPEKKEGKNGPIYAFAQTDDFMRNLLDDENDTVAALAEARLSEKSNIVQTRSERLGWMSTRGPMCVYLAYSAAHTTRWGGGDKLNWQNFPRASRLGKAIKAPPGHLLVVNDASQIECRILNEVAGQQDKIEDFRQGRDPYVGVATAFYGYEVNKTDHPEQRQVGKVLELQAGYGSGGPKIVGTLRRGGVVISQEDGMRARDAYRTTHPFVVNLWEQAGDVLSKLSAGLNFDWGPLTIKDKCIWLPNGAPLLYDTLEWHVAEDGDKFWRIKTRYGHSKLYGAKLVENVIQALARLHVSQAWLRCRSVGLDMVSMEHDKLIAVVRESEAEAAFAFMKQEMSRAPEWLPNIPLDSEGYISDTFAKPEK